MERKPLPEILYKYRSLSGLAEYRHIKGNLYEDTSCTNHINCRITVKRCDGYFDVNGLENDSAKEYDYLHKFIESDSHLYEDSKSPYIEVYSWHIENYEKKILENNKKIEEYEEQIKYMTLENEIPQTISALDYDNEIITLHKKNSVISTVKIIEKVFNKNGLSHLNTNCEHKVYDTKDKKYLDVVLSYRDNDEEVEEHFLGFLSKDDMTVYIKNKTYYDLLSVIDKCKEETDKCYSRIEKLKEALEKIKKE